MATESTLKMRDIATPSRLAQAKVGPVGAQQELCEAVTGFPFQLWGWLRYVEQRILEAMMSPQKRYIIVNVPPRAGKTTYSGVFLPAWFLGMFPSKRVMFVSYADDFSVDFGRAVRTILDRFGQGMFRVGVDKSAQGVSDWKMRNSFGGMLSTGVGGVLTGKGGDLIIVDDIIKNIQEAMSNATKRMHEKWFDSTLLSRLEPGGTLIITATRWADDDISGVLIERMKEPGYNGPKWEVIDLPALATPTDEELQLMSEMEVDDWVDVLGRHIGESLNPERMTAEDYAQLRDSGMDPYVWSCLYQQRPSASRFGMFPEQKWKHWNQANLPPRFTRKVRVWDLAATEGGGDWSVGTLMGLAPSGDLFVLDRWRGQLSSHALEMKVMETARSDGWGVAVRIEKEKAGAGKTVVEAYQRLLAGYDVGPATVEGTKEQRATPYSMMMQAGRVWLPEHADWLREWKKEHAGMIGNGVRPRHDDQIDTAAYCVLYLLEMGETTMWLPGDPLPGSGADAPEQPQVDRLIGEVPVTPKALGIGRPQGHGYPAHLVALWSEERELVADDGEGAPDPPELVADVTPPRRVHRSGPMAGQGHAA